MKKARLRLLEAHHDAQHAETRFKATLGTAKVEFRPANIAGNAVQNAKDRVSDAAAKTRPPITSRPGAIVAVGSAIGLFLFQPIAATIQKLLERRKNAQAPVQTEVAKKTKGAGPKPDPTPQIDIHRGGLSMTIKDSASKAGKSVRESYRATRVRAEDAHEAAAARSSELYASAREQAAIAGRRTADTVQNNPLAAIVGGLGVGMLIGALLPGTRRETEWLEPYGSEITGRARDVAAAARAIGQKKLDELGFVKETARDIAQKAVDEAKAEASEAGAAAASKVRGEE